MDKLFWGKVSLASCYAYYRFEKGSGVQQLVYQLKYRGMKEIGEMVGRWLAHEIMQLPKPPIFDVVVPVPLHPSKERARGYNQSAWFAQGIAEVLSCKMEPHLLNRRAQGTSQTRKSRFARWKNTNDLFVVNPAFTGQNKHYLLVDDVVTTGATMESCANSLLSLPGSKVSAAAIALAG
jgi:ComF family protein